MTMTQTEQILVVPTELFHSLGYFQGFCHNVDAYLDVLLDPINTKYLPRPEMEVDPQFKQLIPYCIFRHRDEAGDVWLFQYQRGLGQGESRLHKKRSVGVGGHISSVDANEDSPYEQGLRRELNEEVEINSDYEQSCVGLINDDESEVGRVHLGVVHVFDVVKPLVRPMESDLANAGFVRVEEVIAQIDEFETWSKICLRALF